MKSIFTICLTVISLLGFAAEPIEFANEPLEYDVLLEDFGPLNQIEKIVSENPSFDLNDVKNTHPELVVDISENTNSLSVLNEGTLGIPPFWWGFCLGIWGLIIVLILTDKDKSSVSQAFKGLLTCLGVVAAAYLILIIAGVTLSSSL